jgi:hypothetical protein
MLIHNMRSKCRIQSRKLLLVTTIDTCNVRGVTSKDIYVQDQRSDKLKSLMKIRETKILCKYKRKDLYTSKDQQEK